MGRLLRRLDALGPGPFTPGAARLISLVHAVHQLGQAVAEVRIPAVTTLSVLALALVWFRPRLAMAVAFGASLVAVVVTFPATANHVYLGGVTSLLLALLDPSREDEALQLRRSLLALPVLALFHGGLAKLIHGAWFEGEALAWLLMVRFDVRAALSLVMPAAEVARLSGQQLVAGAGPFRLSGPLLLVSNLVWVVELAVPAVVLAAPRLGRWVLPALAVGLQLVAHEWTFSLLLLTMCLPLATGSALRASAPVLMGLCALLLAAQLRWVPVPPSTLPTVDRLGGPP